MTLKFSFYTNNKGKETRERTTIGTEDDRRTMVGTEDDRHTMIGTEDDRHTMIGTEDDRHTILIDEIAIKHKTITIHKRTNSVQHNLINFTTHKT